MLIVATRPAKCTRIAQGPLSDGDHATTEPVRMVNS